MVKQLGDGDPKLPVDYGYLDAADNLGKEDAEDVINTPFLWLGPPCSRRKAGASCGRPAGNAARAPLHAPPTAELAGLGEAPCSL